MKNKPSQQKKEKIVVWEGKMIWGESQVWKKQPTNQIYMLSHYSAPTLSSVKMHNILE